MAGKVSTVRAQRDPRAAFGFSREPAWAHERGAQAGLRRVVGKILAGTAPAGGLSQLLLPPPPSFHPSLPPYPSPSPSPSIPSVPPFVRSSVPPLLHSQSALCTDRLRQRSGKIYATARPWAAAAGRIYSGPRGGSTWRRSCASGGRCPCHPATPSKARAPRSHLQGPGIA